MITTLDGATGAQFSHSDLYPTLARVVPSDAYQGTVLAELITGMYGWKRVMAWASTDNTGTDILSHPFNSYPLPISTPTSPTPNPLFSLYVAHYHTPSI